MVTYAFCFVLKANKPLGLNMRNRIMMAKLMTSLYSVPR